MGTEAKHEEKYFSSYASSYEFLSGVLFTIYNQEIVGTSKGFQVTILGNVFDYE